MKEQKMDDKLILQCDCHGMEFMEFLKFKSFPEDPNDRYIYVTFGGCEIYGLWRRLKMAWKIIRHGEYENDGILIYEEKDKLIKWLKKLKK
jgi:hypothetical protein